MADDEKVLSQADIDALLSSASPELPASNSEVPAATATKTRAPKTSPAAKSQSSKSAATTAKGETTAKKEPDTLPGTEVKPYQQKSKKPAEVDTLKRSLEDVARRLEKIESVIAQMGQVEKKMARQITELSGKGPDKGNVYQQVQDLSEQMDEISDNLRSSLGYGAAKLFNCCECGSSGTVAIHVKCTQCGEENWMGWWPDED